MAAPDPLLSMLEPALMLRRGPEAPAVDLAEGEEEGGGMK